MSTAPSTRHRWLSSRVALGEWSWGFTTKTLVGTCNATKYSESVLAALLNVMTSYLRDWSSLLDGSSEIVFKGFIYPCPFIISPPDLQPLRTTDQYLSDYPNASPHNLRGLTPRKHLYPGQASLSFSGSSQTAAASSSRSALSQHGSND